MFNSKLQSQGYEIVQCDAQSVVFSNNGKLFTVATSHTGLTVYRTIRNGNDFQLLPGYKEGKSFQTVVKFVEARS